MEIEGKIKVLHVAIEAGPAVFGGLGRVATQMLDAQNRFTINDQAQCEASIISPFYPHLYKDFISKEPIAIVPHLYNNQIVHSTIYLAQQNGNKLYLVEPPIEYRHLFNIYSKPEIYADTESSNFIDRIKFFNSLVAAYVNNPSLGKDHPQTQILHLHDWQAALVPKLLKEKYMNTTIKHVFMVHIDSGDRGTFSSESLQGIGLEFKKDVTILKAVGLINADKIAAVSPKFLRECIEVRTDDPELEFIRKIFALSAVQNKTAGIPNGINYQDFCPIPKLITDPSNIFREKLRLKHELSKQLCGSRLIWKFDPNLPLILFVGRYSPEKGPEVFEQVIRDVAGKATFVAIGRGMTDDVFRILVKHSRQTDNVFVTASEIEQAKYIELIRACADIVLISSHRDAFGLVGPEGLANGSVIVTTGVGGLKDVVQQLNYSDPNATSGNGIFYEDLPEGGYNPSLTAALNKSLNIFQTLSVEQLNLLQQRIMFEARKFDWRAPNGSLSQYQEIYKELLAERKSVQMQPMRV